MRFTKFPVPFLRVVVQDLAILSFTARQKAKHRRERIEQKGRCLWGCAFDSVLLWFPALQGGRFALHGSQTLSGTFP